MSKNKIPTYSIGTFKRSPEHAHYQVEEFNYDRAFNVSYPHRHDFYEILLITEGTGSYTIDFNEYALEPATIFFVSPGQVHTIKYNEEVKGFIFLFTPDFYLLNKNNPDKLAELPYFNHFSGHTPPLKLSRSNDLALMVNLFNQAGNEQTANDLDSDDMIRAILDIILILCKRRYPVLEAEENTLKGKTLVKNFHQLVEKKYQQHLKVKDYAALLHVTASHLNEMVKKHTGRTASDWADKRTILEIKRVLVHTELNVNEIAEKFNFLDQSYFSKFFKKSAGVTPKAFRANVR